MSETPLRELARRWVQDHDEGALAEYCEREAARLHDELSGEDDDSAGEVTP